MDSGRADRVGGGSATERGRTTAMPGQLGSGVERVDGSSSMRHIQQGLGSAPAPDARAAFRAAGRRAEQGDGSVPYLNKVSIDEARRRGNGNPDNEDDVLMRNDSEDNLERYVLKKKKTR